MGIDSDKKEKTDGTNPKWCCECQQAFETLKASSDMMVHNNPDQPLKLDCYMLDFGVGAVLSHVFLDGIEKPIAYASHTLTKK